MAIKFLSSGNVTGGLTLSGALSGTSASFTGDLAINTNKFTVNATNGNTVVGGTLNTGAITGTSANLTTSGTVLSLDRTGGATALVELKVDGTIEGYLGANTTKSLIVFNESAAEKFSVSNGGNGIFAGTITSGTITSGALTVGSSGTSRFTDTNAFPLQLNRGLDVDSVGANGAFLSIGSIKAGTYVDAIRMSGALASNGTDGTYALQTLGGGSYTTALTINSSQNSTFAGTVETTTLRTDVVNNKANSANIIYRSGTSTLVGGGSTANKLYVLDSGNVGIGTTSPTQAKLCIDGAQNSIYLTRGGASDTKWTIQSDSASMYIQEAVGSYVLTLKENQHVGIGTTQPATKLHLGGTAPGDSIIRQDSTVSGTNWEIGERVAGKWQIFEDDGNTIVATFMSTGNVGIGTDSPERKLDVKSNSDTAPSAYLRGGKSSQGEIQNTGLIVGTQTEIAAGDYQGISFTGYTAAGAIHRSRAAVGVLAVNGPGKMDLVFMAKHQDDGTGLLSDDIKMVIKGSLTSNKQSRVGIGYDFVASKIHEPEGSNALDVYGTGFFGYQDFRDHDTYPPQKVLVLRGAPASGAYAQSRFNWYTKSGTTSNGIAAIQIKSQYGTDAESGVLFHFGGSGNVGIGTDSPTGSRLVVNDVTDGDKIRLEKSGVLVGSVGTFNGVPYIGYQGGAGGGIMFNGASIEPTALGSSRTNNANDIGSANHRWRNAYLGGGVFLGGTGTANKLDDYEEGTWTPVIKDLFGNQASTSAALGTYRKIGSQLIVNYDVRLSSKGSMTGNYVLLALPFTHAGSTCGTGTIDKFNNMTTAFSSMAWDTTSTNTVAWLVGVEGTSATSSVYVTPAEISSTTKFKGTIIYHQ